MRKEQGASGLVNPLLLGLQGGIQGLVKKTQKKS
jgi:hypothetical protein